MKGFFRIKLIIELIFLKNNEAKREILTFVKICPGGFHVNEECKTKFVEVLVGHEEFKGCTEKTGASRGAFGVIGNNGFHFLVLDRFPYYLI